MHAIHCDVLQCTGDYEPSGKQQVYVHLLPSPVHSVRLKSDTVVDQLFCCVRRGSVMLLCNFSLQIESTQHIGACTAAKAKDLVDPHLWFTL